MIRFVCGTCGERLSVPDAHAGRKGACPTCLAVNRIPLKGMSPGAPAVTAGAPRIAEQSVSQEAKEKAAMAPAPVSPGAPLAQPGPAAGLAPIAPPAAVVQPTAGTTAGSAPVSTRPAARIEAPAPEPVRPSIPLIPPRGRRQVSGPFKIALLVIIAVCIVAALWAALFFALRFAVPMK